MKKLITIFLGLFLTASFMLAQNFWDKHLINQNFNGWQVLPAGWGSANTGGGSITVADSIRFAGSGTGSRGADLLIPANRDSAEIHVDFDVFIGSATVQRNNAYGLFLSGTASGTVGSATAFDGLIAGVYLAGTSGRFHVWNLDIRGPVPAARPDTIVPVFIGGSFARPAKTNAWADSINASTRTNVIYQSGQWYNFKYRINFNTKKLDITITQRSNPSNTQFIPNLDFIRSTANDLRRIGMINTRSTTTYPGVTQPVADVAAVGNGSNANLSAWIDNLQVYEKVRSLGYANVTVKYQDLNGNQIRPDRVAADQEIGLRFGFIPSDIASFTENNVYYAFDPVATGALDVMVATGGVTLTARFKATPLTAGTYIWKGRASQFWNELDANFTTDNINEIAFQSGNAIELSDPNAPIKDIVLNSIQNMGDNNLTVQAPGYSLTGTGVLNGTGSIIVNATSRLGFNNRMTGPLWLNKDTLTVTDAFLANRYIVQSGATFAPRVNLATPIEGSGLLNFIPAVFSYTNPVTGFEQINIMLSAKGNLATMASIPRMLLVPSSNTRLNVVNITADTVQYDTQVQYANNSIHLGDRVLMTHSTAPLANGTTTLAIGELTGNASSALVGNNVRVMTYVVGSLNTDAEFAGSLRPRIFDAWAARANYNITKVGNGTWTLSGESPNFIGNIRVHDGTLRVNGLICDMQGSYTFGTTVVPKRVEELFVADTATLSGSGFIGAATAVVNGTITGNLTLGGTLSLKPDLGMGGATTLINVSADHIDKIKVVGDLNYGGKLVVRTHGRLPAPGSYQILEFGNFFESGIFGFDSIELPSVNWSFNYQTGMLTYAGGDDTSVTPVELTREIKSKEYFDLTGRKVTKYHEGIVFVKVTYSDGTTTTVKKFIRR